MKNLKIFLNRFEEAGKVVLNNAYEGMVFREALNEAINVKEAYELAKIYNVAGRSKMNKAELIYNVAVAMHGGVAKFLEFFSDDEVEETKEIAEDKTNDMDLQLTTSDEGIFQIVDIAAGDTAHSNMTDGGRESVLYFIDKLDVSNELTIINGEGLPIVDEFRLVAERPNDVHSALYESIRIYSILKRDMKVSLTLDEKAGQRLVTILKDKPITATEIGHFIGSVESEAVKGQFNGIEVVARIERTMLGDIFNVDIMEA